VCARLYPLDKVENAKGVRRPLEPIASRALRAPPTGIAPLLAKLMAQQAATGLPPPYLPKDELTDNEGETR
jgi:hypothetical protein